MDRKEKLLAGIDVAQLSGAEIGALCRPFVTEADGRVIYVDHASTDDLRKKYINDPGVEINDLVEVAAVWGEKTLSEAVGTTVDYVVASHVIEHVPDLVTWLEEITSILVPSGELRLIVPDKRFTFDYLRAESRPCDVLYSRLIRARRPHAQIVLDYVLNVVKLDGAQAWRGRVNDEKLERHHTIEQAMGVAQSAADGTYHDVHCWVFTPASFCLLFVHLIELGVVCFECTNFHDTAPDTNEFFVGMRPTRDAAGALASWKKAVVRCNARPRIV
jgi:predicted SAM-dependent methyltransferase